VANRAAKLCIELVAVEHDFVIVNRRDGGKRDRKLSRVLDVDLELWAPKGSDLADRADFFSTVGNKNLKTNFDVRQFLDGHLLNLIPEARAFMIFEIEDVELPLSAIEPTHNLPELPGIVEWIPRRLRSR
jgi:hypothetical protein